jgi:CRISPR system Cascade subunit CasE
MVMTLEKPAQAVTEALYLSRVRLRRDPSVQALAPLLLPRDAADRRSAEHKLLWSALTDDPERQRDFLWRREAEGQWLVLSRREPVGTSGLFDIETKPWQPALSPGQRLGFALRAHATVDRRNGGRATRKRHEIVMERLHSVPPGQRALVRDTVAMEAGSDWLFGRGARAGFLLERLTQAEYATERVSRRGRPLDLGVLDLAGVLVVEDANGLVDSIAEGFGRCRSFGYGLMLLRRA